MISALTGLVSIPLISIAVAGLLFALHRESDSRAQKLVASLVSVWPVLAICGIVVVSHTQSPSGASKILWWVFVIGYALILILAKRSGNSRDRRGFAFWVASASGLALLMIASMVAWGDWLWRSVKATSFANSFSCVQWLVWALAEQGPARRPFRCLRSGPDLQSSWSHWDTTFRQFPKTGTLRS